MTFKSYAEFRDGWKVVVAGAFGAGAGITGILTNSRSILLNPLSDAFGWSRTAVSVATSFLTIGIIVTAPFVGYFADRIGVRRIGIVSMVLLALATLCVTQVSGNVELFSFAFFMLAVAGCGTTPLIWSRGVGTWFVRRRGLAFALMTTGTGVSWVLTPSFLGALLRHHDWRSAYIGMSTIAFVSLIPIILFFHENHGQGRRNVVDPAIVHIGIDVRAALFSTRFWRLGFGFLLISGVVASLNLHLIALLTDAGVSRDMALNLSSILGAGVVIGRLVPGYLVDRVHPPFVAAAVLAMPIISCALLVGKSLSFGPVVFAAISIGLAAGAEVDLLPYLIARYYGLKAYGKIYGFQFIMLYLGAALGPILLGRMYDLTGNYDAGLRINIPLLAIGVVAIATLGKPPVFENAHAEAGVEVPSVRPVAIERPVT